MISSRIMGMSMVSTSVPLKQSHRYIAGSWGNIRLIAMQKSNMPYRGMSMG